MSLKRKGLTSVLALMLTAALSAQPVLAYSNVTLRTGMRSNDVYSLQEDLNNLGFMTVKPTGYYGSITKAAVLKMQKEYGLQRDGIAGRQTLGKLEELTAEVKAAETVVAGAKATEAEAAEAMKADVTEAVTIEAAGAKSTDTIVDIAEAAANTALLAGAIATDSAETAAESKTTNKAADTVTEAKTANTAEKPEAEKAPAKTSRGDLQSAENIISYAKRFMGLKYVWGGTTPKGFDCSGFIKYVYGHFDVSLNRNSAAQAENGTYIKKTDLLPGDLVFFDTNGGKNHINHVGIYIGNGKMIHSSSSHKGVVISTINSGFYSKAYMTARRVI